MGKYAVLSTELKRLTPLIRQGVGSTVLWLGEGRSGLSDPYTGIYLRKILNNLENGTWEAYCLFDDRFLSGVIIWQGLDWDSGLLGIGCGRVHLTAGSGLDRLISSWKARLRGLEIEYVTGRFLSVPGELKRAGFARLEDVVYLTGLSDAPGLPRSVREGRQSDKDAAVQIASRAYRLDRFHAETVFSVSDADRLHGEWAASCFSGRADANFVAEIGGEVVGFCSCILPEEGNSGAGWIDMLAVSPELRRRGIGKNLVRAARRYFGTKGMERVALCTQSRNLPALNLYIRSGFRRYQSAVTLRLSLL
jgi:dTDP-4-amino-4,6-dideoxy-D-galactose acyltransferase